MRNVKRVLVLGGAEPPSSSRVWSCSIKLTESIRAAPSDWVLLPFLLRAAHYASALFLFNAAVGRMIKVICMKGAHTHTKKLVTGQDLKQLNDIQKSMKS